MLKYALRRIALMVPTVLGVTVLVFVLIRLMPGSAVDTLLGDARDPETVRLVKERLGLNDPPVRAYFLWLGHIAQGDLGVSLISGRPVSDVITQALPTTLEFAMLGMLIALVISLPIGILSAARQNQWPDYLFRGSAIMFIAIPAFWVGIMSKALPSYFFGWLPPTFVPLKESVPDHIYGMIVPSIVLGIALSGTQIRITRTALLNVLREDYVRTARSKGLSERTILLRHALRNAALPLITLVAIQFSHLVMGTVVLERVYGIPGLGQQLLGAIGARDYPVLQGIQIVFALATLLTFLFVDLLYAYFDPRIKFS